MALTPYISPYDVYVDRLFVRGGTVFFTEAQAGSGWRTPTAAEMTQQILDDQRFRSYPRVGTITPTLVGTLTQGVAASGQTIINAQPTGPGTLLIDGNASGLTVSGSGTTRTITGTSGASGALTGTGAVAGVTGTVAVNTPYTFTDADAAAYVARMTGDPLDNTKKAAIDNFFITTAPDRATADDFGFGCLPTQQASYLKVKQLGGASITNGGSAPIHVPNNGIYVDGSDDWLDLGFSPATATFFAQDSAMMACYARHNLGNQLAPSMGVTGSQTRLWIRNGTGGVMAARINERAITGASVAAQGYGHGLSVGQLNSASAGQLWKNGAKNGTGVTAGTSTAKAAGNFCLGRGMTNGSNTAYQQNQFGFWWVGGPLSDARMAIWAPAVETVMAALGCTALPYVEANKSAVNTLIMPDNGILGAGQGFSNTGIAYLPSFIGANIALMGDTYHATADPGYPTIQVVSLPWGSPGATATILQTLALQPRYGIGFGNGQGLTFEPSGLTGVGQVIGYAYYDTGGALTNTVTASVTGDVLTVTARAAGGVPVGGTSASFTGNILAWGTAGTTGRGGLGTYKLSASQTVASTSMSLIIPAGSISSPGVGNLGTGGIHRFEVINAGGGTISLGARQQIFAFGSGLGSIAYDEGRDQLVDIQSALTWRNKATGTAQASPTLAEGAIFGSPDHGAKYPGVDVMSYDVNSSTRVVYEAMSSAKYGGPYAFRNDDCASTSNQVEGMTFVVVDANTVYMDRNVNAGYHEGTQSVCARYVAPTASDIATVLAAL